MAGIWYRAGAVSVTSGSKKVTGFGTQWQASTWKVEKGHAWYGPDGKPYEIDYVESDTVLYLVTAYGGPTAASQSYAIDITRTGTIPAFSRQLSAQLAYAQGQFDSWQQILTGVDMVTLTAPDGQQVQVPSLAAMQPKSDSLQALQALTPKADELPYFSGPKSAALTKLTAFIRTLLDDDNPAAAQATLGVKAELDARPGRNKIINGDMRISQRGANGQTYGQNSGGYAGPDRFSTWNNQSSVAGKLVHQQTLQGGYYWCHQWVNGEVPSFSGNAYWHGINQAIEGLSCFDLLGESITVSFLFRSSMAGMHSLSLRTPGGYTFVTTFNYLSANANQRITITIPPCPAALAADNTAALYLCIGAIAVGPAAIAPSSSWQSSGAIAATTAVNWATINGYIMVTELQLEAGSVATPFESLDYGTSLSQCRRYYQLVTAAQRANAGWLYGAVSLPITMRTSPTATLQSVIVDELTSKSITLSSSKDWFIINISNAQPSTSQPVFAAIYKLEAEL